VRSTYTKGDIENAELDYNEKTKYLSSGITQHFNGKQMNVSPDKSFMELKYRMMQIATSELKKY
jgi:hypothetical protein